MRQNDEFGLLCETLKRCRVQVATVRPSDLVSQVVTDGFHLFIEGRIERDATVSDLLGTIEPETLYKLSDEFKLCYLAFRQNGMGEISVIGPYTTEPITNEKILEISEKNSISPNYSKAINEYFLSVPEIPEASPVFTLIDSYLERMWGRNYRVTDNSSVLGTFESSSLESESRGIDDTLLDMKNMERRYALENEIITAVMQGNETKVKRLFSGFSQNSFENRIADPIRNLKNYSIIMNTLLRKAAESGGVHPMFLDKISSSFAIRIENTAQLGAMSELMEDMFRSYCRLVNKHSLKRYSSLIKRAITVIEADLSVELNLSTLAGKLGVSSGYLSAAFRRETGRTVTEYIREKRLELATHLLRSTALQIQTVALHCGMVDVQYFSKVFKKHIGKTPTEFRSENL